MSVIAGRKADIYIATGSGTAFTGKSCSVVSGTTYQIDDTAKRFWDPTATFVVYDGGVAIAAGGYELIYGTGKIVLKTAPGGAVTVDGKYLSVSQLGQSDGYIIDFGPDLAETQTFGATWKTRTALLRSGTITVKRFYADSYFLTNISGPFLLVLYPDSGGTATFRAIGFAKDQIQVDENSLIRENVSFETSGWIDSTT